MPEKVSKNLITTTEQHKPNPKTFLCTRPQLATILIESGFQYEQKPNPFNNQMTAWIFPINPELVGIVKDFYASIQRPVPAKIKDWSQDR
jgi:hypothetical protein